MMFNPAEQTESVCISEEYADGRERRVAVSAKIKQITLAPAH